MKHFLCALVASATLIGAGVPAGASGFEDRVTLSQPGAVTEIRGIRHKVIAFYEPTGTRMTLTMLLGGASFGGNMVRTSVKLVDGQSHAIRIGDFGDTAETFSFRREGDRIDASFETRSVSAGDTPGPAAQAAGGDRIASVD